MSDFYDRMAGLYHLIFRGLGREHRPPGRTTDQHHPGALGTGASINP